LAGLKNRDPGLYDKKLDEMREKYEPIREAERRNPELAVVLRDDLRLKERRDELITKINTTRNQDEKERLTRELQNVVAARYDIIVKRKIIAYEQLLKRLEELKNWMNRSRAEIVAFKKEDAKAENVKQRMKTLLGGKKGFDWGD
jgi:hypothetical protein